MVEEFLIEDSEKMIAEPEHLEEWTKTVEELGLEGQKELHKPDKSPIPFLSMNRVMERVYETLCPSKEDVHQYNKSTIPLRVLSLIALAETEKYFNNIKIWSDETNPDPIAIGYTTDKYNSPMFLIARWGDELKDFVTLKKEAINRWKEQRIAGAKKELKTANSKIDNVDNDAELYFQGQWV